MYEISFFWTARMIILIVILLVKRNLFMVFYTSYVLINTWCSCLMGKSVHGTDSVIIANS
jgi:hypothetical protein